MPLVQRFKRSPEARHDAEERIALCRPQQFVDRRDQGRCAQQDRRLRYAEHALQKIAGDHLLLNTAAGVGGKLGGQCFGLHPPHLREHAQECTARSRHRRDGRRPLDVRRKQIGVEIGPLHDRFGQCEQTIDHVFPVLRRDRRHLGQGEASTIETTRKRSFNRSRSMLRYAA